MSTLIASLIAARDGVDVEEDAVLFWLGVALVVGCLVAAAVATFKYAHYIGAGILVVIAVIAAVLLL